MKWHTCMRHSVSRMVVALSVLLVTCFSAAAAEGLRLVPDSIRIGAFFSGDSVRVSGEIPAGSRAIVEVIGKRLEEQLMRKGRRWEIWMSVGEIDIEEAPNLYLVLSTSPDEFAGLGADAEFGYEALENRVDFTGDTKGMPRPEIFRRFIELKEKENLYRQRPGALKVTGSQGGLETVEGTFRIPSRVAPGDYKVRLSVVDQGRLLHSETVMLSIRMTGMPAFLTSLARKHGALYGLFAVAIAAIVGLLVGMAFRRGQGH